ncbi:hypothetical protein GGS23DRAFT_394905 [Durotheca rogersii]|uniref:uncharacterized protein n=1 Tax=Durotheca rogersii TaxID=419775 RepID=UPI00222129D9|nr:uncharacterized protein GGS23DRAFT_394905 [Durotheca rogersii]KAI5856686.1 hypothetical protein GGS23DRAFT_394905 [Durotheca rogersii]
MPSTDATSNRTAQPGPEPSPQVSNLRDTTTYLTGHNDEGSAVVRSERQAKWTALDGGKMGFNQIYTNTFLADLNDDADIKFHDEKVASGKLGLASKGAAVCRMVDFGPLYQCVMHRTKSLDFGILIEGEIEMVLDDGSVTRLKRGDIAVQRATMHSWRNPSPTEWARMVFVLQDAKPVFVNGEKLDEDYGAGTEGMLPSGNEDD